MPRCCSRRARIRRKWPSASPDLKSRLTSSAVFAVRELNDEEQIEALNLRAHLRGFELPAETARYLQRRFPRDMRTLCEILDTLDDAAFAAQRRLTVPFIRDVIDGKTKAAGLASRRAPRGERGGDFRDAASQRLRERDFIFRQHAGLRRETGDMRGAIRRAAGARLIQRCAR